MSPIRLEPRDEYLHENTGEPNFNESMYFNFFDAAQRLGGFARIGNRPNERYAETTICLYEPDGAVLFNFKRAEIADNSRFEAGGMRFETQIPFEKLEVAYRGKACRLRDPLAMNEPGRAFKENPFVPVELELAIRGVGPMFGGEPTEHRADDIEFARGHYEQHHHAAGSLEIDGKRFEIDGFGLRDHSWGPRSWQAPAYYRWLTANFGEDFGFMGSHVVRPDGGETRGGFVHRGRELILVRDLEIETEWREDGTSGERAPFPGSEPKASGELGAVASARPPSQLHDRIRARLHCADGKRLDVEGRVLSLIPLRNRKGGRLTRISEGMTEWTCEGRTGYGLSEYLDQIA